MLEEVVAEHPLRDRQAAVEWRGFYSLRVNVDAVERPVIRRKHGS